MRPQVIKQSGTGSTAWIPLDYKQSPFNVGIGVLASGTVTYTVEHTFDDVWDSTITPTVYPHATLVTQTTNKDGNYAFPVRAARITVTAGTGDATMTILQGLR
jgi:uncharacterized membrane protein